MEEINLLLASQSPRRHELLSLLGLPFVVDAAGLEETQRPGEPPSEMVIRLSRAKARAASAAFGSEEVSRVDALIACDTTVAFEGRVLGKPDDASEAASMLRRLRGRVHAVYSGLTVMEPSSGRVESALAETTVRMRSYDDAELAAYVASGDPLDKAGAYAIQHDGFHPVAALEGCYASVMGLPLCHLTRRLRAWGIEVSVDVPSVCQRHNVWRCHVYSSILNQP
jgi:MAF protein